MRIGVVLLAVFVALGAASHFRYGTISWAQAPAGGRQVLFKTDQAWRKDYGYSPCGGGSSCVVGQKAVTGTLYFTSGNPSSSTVTLTITSVDNTNNYFVGTYSAYSTFPGNGPYQVSFYTCCRIGGIVNNPAELATTTTVFFPTGRSQASPVTNVAPIINMQQNKDNRFYLPASDSDLDLIKFSRVAIGDGAGNINSLTIDPVTGLIFWNPGGSTRGLYTVVFKMEDYDSRSCTPPVTSCPASARLSDVMVDFFIQVIPNDGNRPPVINVPPTPAAGSSVTAAQGEAVTFPISVNDPDGDAFSLVSAWSVPDMTFTGATSGTGSLTSGFSWTVPVSFNAVNQACFIARDSRGNEAPMHCVTIKVGTITVTSATNDANGANWVYADGVGQKVRLTGKNMAAGTSYKCRYALNGVLTVANAVFVSQTQINCDVPNLRTSPGLYTVEASKDGSGFTGDGKTITLKPSCPPSIDNMCNGRGTCLDTGICQCNSPFSGAACQSQCGNGKLEQGESCDDGNTANGDGCSSTCQIQGGCTCAGEPSLCQCCGNSKREGTETCDDGNTTPGDGCNAACAVEGGYTCSTASPNVCQRCGNGKREGTETCDDGNTNANDGCSATCATESGWTCSTASPNVCQKCGNGRREGTETCDDGNTTAGDGCDAVCAVESGFTCSTASPNVCQKCGNGKREGSEECDDGNQTNSNDGCLNNCKIENGWKCTNNFPSPDTCVVGVELCGNGKIDGTEACDDGNKSSGDGCSSACVVEATWTCVGGTTSTPSQCYKCGNSVIETYANPAENCDDGNNVAGDGCSAQCTAEQGFTCGTAVPSVCQNCGNGKLEGTEACDDGNAVDNDGCTKCAIDAGYSCSNASPNVCQKCGNGIIEGSEVCDDGNTADGDGCTGSSCQVEDKWECPPEKRISGRSVCNVIFDPPLTPGTIVDVNPATMALGDDVNWVGVQGTLAFRWYGFVDPKSYDYKLGTTIGGNEIVADWTPVPATTLFNGMALVLTGLELIHDKQYFLSVRSTNSKAKYSYGLSDGVRYDGTAPEGGRIIDGIDDDTEWTSETASANMFYLPIFDPETGVGSLEYSFGLEADERVWAPIPGNLTTIALTGLKLTHGQQYFWYIRANNTLGRSRTIKSNGFGVDKVAPLAVGVEIVVPSYQGFANKVSAHWDTQFTDSNSGVAKIEWALYSHDEAGTTKTYLKPFADIGLGQVILVSTEANFLEDKKTYAITVRATDKVGLTAEKNSDDFTVDLSPPDAGEGFFGTSSDPSSETNVWRDASSISLGWSAWADPESRIASYSVGLTTVQPPGVQSVNTSAPSSGSVSRRMSLQVPGEDVVLDVANFTSSGANTFIKFTDLNLAKVNGKKVYAVIRGFNGAGSWTDAPAGPVEISLDETNSGDKAKSNDKPTGLNSPAGKGLLGAGVAAAALLIGGIAAFMVMKAMRKAAMKKKAANAKQAQREAARRNSSQAIDNKEFAMDNLDGNNGGKFARDPNDEVESAGFV